MEKCVFHLLVVCSLIGCVIISSAEDTSHKKGTVKTNSDMFFVAVAGGINAKPKELPFMAALGYEDGDAKRYLCGGSLISESFVLTAAHCIYSRTWGPLKFVRLGDLNITSPADDANAQEFQVKRHHIHPNYAFPERYHDIALLELNGRVNLTNYVTPVSLNMNTDVKLREFYAAGWGLLGTGEDPSSYLQVAKLQYYDINVCQKTFSSDATIPRGIVDDFQLCAGAIDHIADTCEGDSGGPLAYREPFSGNLFYLAGITSFGKACALGKIPAVYTRVSYYVGWIESVVWPDKSNIRDKIFFPDELGL